MNTIPRSLSSRDMGVLVSDSQLEVSSPCDHVQL